METANDFNIFLTVF